MGANINSRIKCPAAFTEDKKLKKKMISFEEKQIISYIIVFIAKGCKH